MKQAKGKRILAFLLAFLLSFTTLSSDFSAVTAVAAPVVDENAKTITMEVGDTHPLPNKYRDGNNDYDVTWTLNNGTQNTAYFLIFPTDQTTFVTQSGNTLTAVHETANAPQKVTVSGWYNKNKGKDKGWKSVSYNITVNPKPTEPEPEQPEPAYDAPVAGDGFYKPAITWKRSSFDETILISNYKDAGTGFNWKWSTVSGIGTSLVNDKDVWDSKRGAEGINYNYYYENTVNKDYATWKFDGNDKQGRVNRFIGTFTVPEGYDFADKVQLASNYTGYGMDGVLPINDDIFIFVYKQGENITDANFMKYLAFWSGTSNQSGHVFFNGVEGTDVKTRNNDNGKAKFPHTDGWSSQAEIDNVGELLTANYGDDYSGTFVIDIFTVDYAGGGAMDHIDVKFTKNLSNRAALSIGYYKEGETEPFATEAIKSKPVHYDATADVNNGISSHQPDGYNAGVITETDGNIADLKNGVTNVKVVYSSRAGLTVSVPNVTATYDGKAHGGDVAYQLPADKTEGTTVYYKVGDGNWTETKPTRIDAGTTTVSVKAENPKYDTAETTYKITINKRNVTVTSDSNNKTYDGTPLTDSDITINGDGFVNGQGFTETGAPKATGSVTNVSEGVVKNTITHGTLNSNTEESNYNITYVEGDLKINPKALTINASDINEEYNGQPHGVAATLTGAVAGDNVVIEYYVNNEKQTSYPTVTDVGTKTVTAKVNNSNYSCADKTYTITVYANKGLTVDVDAAGYSGTYDAQYHGGSATASVAGATLHYSYTDENGTVHTDETTAPTFKNVGTHVVNVYATKANYENSAVKTYNVVINPFEIKISAVAASKTYGEADPTSFSVTYDKSKFANEPISYDVALDQSYANANAGTYAGAVKVTADEFQGNYKVTVEDADLTINPQVVPVNIADQTYTYNGQSQGTAPVADNRFSVSYKDADGNTLSSVPQVTNAGTQEFTVVLTGANGNYVVSQTSDLTYKITVNRLAATLNIAGNSDTKAFDNQKHTVDGYEISKPEGSTLSDTLYTEAKGSVSLAENKSAHAEGTEVGNYFMGLTSGSFVSNSGNFNLTFNVTDGKLTIEQSNALTITATDLEKVYDGEALTATASTNNPTGSRVHFEYRVGGTGSFTTVAPSITNVSDGPKSVEIRAVDENGRYAAASKTITMNILPQTVTVTVNGNNGEFTYDGTQKTVSGYTYSIPEGSTLKASDISFNGEATPSISGTYAGGYTLTIDAKKFSVASKNYTATFVANNGLLKINPITTLVTITPNNKSKTYDGTPLGANGYEVTGLLNGHTLEAVLSNNTITNVSQSGATVSVVSYVIKDAAGNDVTSNYSSVTKKTGTLTVNPKSVTVTPNALSKTYGEEDPTLTATVNGTLSGDTVAYSLNRVAGEDAGSYKVTVTVTEPAGSNYKVTGAEGTFTINAKEIRYNIDANQSKVYGDAEPELTGSFAEGYEPLVSDLNGLTVNVTRVSGENAGEYAFNAVTLTNAGDKDVAKNYTLVDNHNEVSFAITPATLVVTVNDAEKTYGDNDPQYTVAFGTVSEDGVVSNAFKNNDNAEGLTYTFTREEGENVKDGGYEVYVVINNLSNNLSNNYTATYVPGTLTINPKDVSFTITDSSKEYGEADPDLTGTFANGDLVGTDSITATVSRATGENVGTYAYNVSFGEHNNYNITVANPNETFEITRATATVTASATGKEYDGEELSYSVAVTGLKNNESESLISYDVSFVKGNTETKVVPTDAGTYTVNVSGDTEQGNYNVVFNDAPATITQKAVTVTAKNKSMTYGKDKPELTVVIAGRVSENDAIAYEVSCEALEGTTSPSVGTYPIVVTIENADQGNYTVSKVDGELNVSTAPVAVVVESITATYGDAIPALSYYVTLDGVRNDNINLNVSLTREDAENVNAGTYTITATGAETQGNYEVTYGTGTLTINPKEVTVTAVSQNKTYDGAALAASATVSELAYGETNQINYTITYKVKGSNASATTVAPKNAGTYDVIVSGAENQGNYHVTFNGTEATIAPKAVTVTASDAEKTYGDPNPASYGWYASDLVEGEVAEQLLNVSVARAKGENVGNYAITPSGAAEQGNYKVTYVPGTFTITKASASVTPVVTGKTYDGTALTATGRVSGLKNNDTASVISYTVEYYDANGQKLDNAPVNAGTYTVKVVPTSEYEAGENGTFVKGNYTVSFGETTVTIGREAVTVTASNASKTFGDTNPTSYEWTATGLVEGEDASELLTVNVARAEGENVGTYAITPSGDAVQGNYDVTFVPGTFTINKATATVTLDVEGKTFDGQPLTYSTDVEGLKRQNPESVITRTVTFIKADGTVLTEAPTDAGTYTVHVTATDTTGNYNVSVPADKTIEIKRATATVTPDNKAQVYGEAPVNLTAKVTGLVGNDTVQYELSRAQGENVGDYTITATGDSVQGNYNVVFNTATYTISAAPIVVVVDNKTKVYGEADPELTYQVVLGKEVTENSAYDNTIKDLLNVTLSRAEGEDVTANGYAITATGNTKQGNYEVKYVDGTLNITKADITIKADAKEKTYGDADPEFTWSVEGLKNGDEKSVLAGVSAGREANDTDNAGTHTILVNGPETFANYNVTYTNGTLTIGQKQITFNIDKDQKKTYGEDDPESFTGSFTGLEDNDDVTYEITREEGENAGKYSYNVTFSGDDVNNYTFVTNEDAEDVFFEIEKKAVTVKADPVTITYGDDEPELTVTIEGLVGNDNIDDLYTVTREEGNNAGTYAITVAGETETDNYTISYEGNELTIEPKTITYVPNEGQKKTYGDEDPEYTGHFEGTLEGDDVTPVWEREEGENVGNYDLTVVGIDGEDAGNYVFEPVTTDFEIIPLVLNVRIVNKTKIFGDADPEFEAVITKEDGSVITKLPNNDEFTLTREEGENIGDYKIYFKLVEKEVELPEIIDVPVMRSLVVFADRITDRFLPDLIRQTSDNYVINDGTTPEGKLTITKRTITLRLTGGSKKYGDPDPAFHVRTENAVSFDPVEAHAYRDAGELPGVYAVRFAIVKLSDNYNPIFVGNTFTITDEGYQGGDEPGQGGGGGTPAITPVAPTPVVAEPEEAAEIEIEEEATPQAPAISNDAEIEIEDEEAPLAAAPHDCFIHWVILLITLLYALYAIARGVKNSHDLREKEAETEN